MRTIVLAGIILAIAFGRAGAEEDFVQKARDALDAGLDATDPEEAERQFERSYIAASIAVARNPDNENPQFYLVEALIGLGRYEEAEKEADIGIIKFGRKHFLSLRGESRLYIGKQKEGLKDLEQSCAEGDDWGCYVLEQVKGKIKYK
jgi:hypothetical protein